MLVLSVVAVMTERIRNLTEHMKLHRKDKSTERNLVTLVNKRRSMMQYLLRKSPGTSSASSSRSVYSKAPTAG